MDVVRAHLGKFAPLQAEAAALVSEYERVLSTLIATNAEAIRAFLSSLLGITIFPPEVFFLSSFPSRTNVSEVTLIVGVALVLSFLATLYPAWRAAQYDPVEALRYE